VATAPVDLAAGGALTSWLAPRANSIRCRRGLGARPSPVIGPLLPTPPGGGHGRPPRSQGPAQLAPGAGGRSMAQLAPFQRSASSDFRPVALMR
jgi:hypothetical protein